jgi:hypothetical protein
MHDCPAAATTAGEAARRRGGRGPAGTRMPRSRRRRHIVITATDLRPFTPEFVVRGSPPTAGPPSLPPPASRPSRSTTITSSSGRHRDGRSNRGTTPTSASPCAPAQGRPPLVPQRQLWQSAAGGAPQQGDGPALGGPHAQRVGHGDGDARAGYGPAHWVGMCQTNAASPGDVRAGNGSGRKSHRKMDERENLVIQTCVRLGWRPPS